MLYDVRGMADNAGDEGASLWKLDLLPHSPLVLMPRVRPFDGIGADVDAKQQVYELLERQVRGVRGVPATPTDVIAGQVFRNAAQRVIERLDAHRRPAAVVVVRSRRHQ